MSLSITFTEGSQTYGPYQLASAGGWRLVGEWANSCLCAPLITLVETGTYLSTFTLARAVKKSLAMVNPDNDEVQHTLEQLLERIGVGSTQETATVTGG